MAFISSLLPFGLALIMFQVGLTLTGVDFRRLVVEPRAVLLGLSAQMLVPPAIALALMQLLPVPAELALGIALIAATPGGVTSNLIALIAGADVALAVTITAFSTCISVFTLPLLVTFAAGLLGGSLPPIAMPVGMMIVGMLTTTIAPLLIGMLVRRTLPGLAKLYEPWLRRLSIGIFGIMVFATFASNAPVFINHGLTLGPAMLLLDVLAMAVAAGIAIAGGLSRRRATAIALESGLHNAAVAIVIAMSVLGRPDLAVAPVIYAFTMNVGALAVIPLARRWIGATPDPSPALGTSGRA